MFLYVSFNISACLVFNVAFWDGKKRRGLGALYTPVTSVIPIDIITKGPDTSVTSELDFLVLASGHVKDTSLCKCMCVVREQEEDQVSGIKHASVWSDTRDNASLCHLRLLQTGRHTPKVWYKEIDKMQMPWASLFTSSALWESSITLMVLLSGLKERKKVKDLTFVTLLRGQALAWP